MSNVIKTVRRGEPPPIHMTDRMREVLSLRASGLRLKEIADEMKVYETTVHWHWAKLVEFFHESDAVAMVSSAQAKKHIGRYWTWPAFYHSELIRLLGVLLAACFLSGCQTNMLSVSKNPPIPPMPPPERTRLTASVSQAGKKNYYLTWTYPQTLPIAGLNFVVLQSNKTSGAWSQLLITNQPPVLLAINQPAQYFNVYPTNSASVTLAWSPPNDPGPLAYVLNSGPQSGNYTVTANSHVTNITVTAVWPTNFYCVKAVDTNNLSSQCSNEIAYSLPPVFPVSGLAVIRQ